MQFQTVPGHYPYIPRSCGTQGLTDSLHALSTPTFWVRESNQLFLIGASMCDWPLRPILAHPP